MTINVIILDFDGVLVESNNIKHQAFSDIFRRFPEYYDKMMAYHIAHNHVHRRDKFKWIYKNIIKKDYTEKEIDELVKEFGRLTTEKIIKCPYVDGAIEFLEKSSKLFPLYLVSATPYLELVDILEKRHLLRFFKKVYGAPIQKIEAFNEIKKTKNIGPAAMLFIGDSPEDEEVARTSGVNFIGRISDYNFDSKKTVAFESMKEISDYILKSGN